MSQLFKTNLEEYARQCTLQRRHYEEGLQQAQKSRVANPSKRSTSATTQSAARESIGAMQSDTCAEQAVQSCMIELLEMPTNPLGLDDENAISGDTSSVFAEEQEWHDDRVQAPYPPVVNPTAKSPSPVGFGAP